MNAPAATMPLFQAPFAPPDEALATALLADAARDRAAESRIDARAKRLVDAIRAKAGGLGGVEEFLHAYSLSTKEGLALMVLAEALLRVPDAATADRLIEDKLAAGRWRDGDVKSTALLVSASAWTLGIAARVIHPGETPETILDSIVRRLGLPRCARRRGRRCGSSARISCSARPSTRRCIAPAATPSSAIRSTCSARGAHRRRCRQIFRRLCRCDRGDRRASRQRGAAAAARHLGETLGAASALRGDVARARARKSWCRALTELAQLARDARSAIHRRCRGGRPAGIVARSHRRRAGRRFAARLGRFWPRGAGLSEARARA